MQRHLDTLEQLRTNTGETRTRGLDDETIERFIERDPSLGEAIDAAWSRRRSLERDGTTPWEGDEAEVTAALQTQILNFYGDDAVSPYVPLAGAGPWIVTTHGAVLHDSAGYGMLGLGHAPAEVLAALAEPYVMANVMTPSLSQKRLTDRLEREIGHTRGACPFERFVCMNSGSEAVSVAARIADIKAHLLTRPGEPRHGWTVKSISLEGGFHGRTDRPAAVSDSTRAIYGKHLASFQERDDLVAVPINDLRALARAFELADIHKVHFDAFFVEPVMGEGIPGLAMDREFYDLARRLTAERGTLLIVDSIQAALRASGCLSIVDYPGFGGCEPPDMETYSKALNAGQLPLSVLALTEPTAELYVKGVYGNTMTANPRALEVGCAVLDSVDDALRQNVRRRGDELLRELEQLADEHPDLITSVHGTGLMVCAELDPRHCKVTGRDGLEERLRRDGIAMIHGGRNGLRFTPHFGITSAEIELIIESVDRELRRVERGAVVSRRSEVGEETVPARIGE